jgi:hypothetical protein
VVNGLWQEQTVSALQSLNVGPLSVACNLLNGGFAMTTRILILIAALVLAGLATAQPATAAGPRLPATLYPIGAHTTYRPSLSNEDMDCLWGFFCEGNVPLFHFQTQDQLHRTDGWGQFAGVQRHGQMVMAFELFASHYAPGVDREGIAWSTAGFHDFLYASRLQGYTLVPHISHLLPRGNAGTSVALLQRGGPDDLVVMASWMGSTEIEAIATFPHRSQTLRAIAVRSLAQQVAAALAATYAETHA